MDIADYLTSKPADRLYDEVLNGTAEERFSEIHARLRAGARIAAKDGVRAFTFPETYRFATRPEIARVRNTLHKEAIEGRRVVDASAGIGLAAIAFSQRAREVIGIEIDPLRCALAEANARLHNAPIRIVRCDAMSEEAREYLIQADLIFCDPARTEHAPTRHLDENTPAYQHFLENYPSVPLLYEVSPRIPIEDLPDCVELFSFKRRHSRTTIIRNLPVPRLRAVNEHGETLSAEPGEMPEEANIPSSLPRYLYDIDPTLLAARITHKLESYGFKVVLLSGRAVAFSDENRALAFCEQKKILGAAESLEEAARIIQSVEDFKRIILRYPVPSGTYWQIAHTIRPTGKGTISVSIYRSDRYLIVADRPRTGA